MRTAKSGTLTPSAITSVTITEGYPSVEIVNRSLTGTIWVTLDGTDPTVAGDNCYPVLGVRVFNLPAPHTTAVTVKLLSTAALDYTVEGDPGGAK